MLSTARTGAAAGDDTAPAACRASCAACACFLAFRSARRLWRFSALRWRPGRGRHVGGGQFGSGDAQAHPDCAARELLGTGAVVGGAVVVVAVHGCFHCSFVEGGEGLPLLLVLQALPGRFSLFGVMVRRGAGRAHCTGLLCDVEVGALQVVGVQRKRTAGHARSQRIRAGGWRA